MDRTGIWQGVGLLAEPPAGDVGYPPRERFLSHLAESRLVAAQDLHRFLDEHPEAIDTPQLVGALLAQNLLNEYQVRQVLSGQTQGLVLGNYRVVDRLGSGGMGVVYKAEHVHMKRPVALKVLAVEGEGSEVFLQRFTSEMQALAVLRHPNIVLAFDAGEVETPGTPATANRWLRYLVMEYVPGLNLEQYVQEWGSLPIGLACDYIRQAASGLRHAHEHGLIHRDVKPSNLLVTGLPPAPEGKRAPGTPHPHGQIKILDFGLARLCRRRCTAAHSMLGTIDYMAPEQARDARSVDIRADIYGLGGTLYWLLTGQRPFPGDRPVVEELLARQYETPVPVRSHRPEIPLDLEAIVCQMMALDPADRYPTPLALIAALDDFLAGHGGVPGDTGFGRSGFVDGKHLLTWPGVAGSTLPSPLLPVQPSDALAGSPSSRVLILSPRPECRASCRAVLEKHGLGVAEAASAEDVTRSLRQAPADVVLIDHRLPEAVELCRRLRAEAPLPHFKLVLLADDAGSLPADGEVLCDEVVIWTAEQAALAARVRLLLRLKEAEDRSDRLAGHLLATNGQLEQALVQRDNTAVQGQEVLIFAMAKMAEMRGQETGAHLLRMQSYVRVLAEEAMRLPAFAPRIDDAFVRMLERCVLLHDIGKVAIPDHVLLKPGKLDPEERSIMESHTVLGANLLEAVARQHGACLAFLDMAIDVVRHHHERYDGAGYPDGLQGEQIPLAARVVALADVYDAMRSKLVYKPGLSHAAVRRLMLTPTQGQFDPALLAAFRQCETAFAQIFEQRRD